MLTISHSNGTGGDNNHDDNMVRLIWLCSLGLIIVIGAIGKFVLTKPYKKVVRSKDIISKEYVTEQEY